MEVKNRADQSVYAAEQMLKDAGDKLSADDKEPVENAIADLKKANEDGNVDNINAALETLNEAQQKAAQALYANTAQASPEGGEPSGDQANPAGQHSEQDSGDVIDAEVVEEEKK